MIRHNDPIYDRENRLKCGPITQAAFELVLDEAATVRMRKVNSYGESRYEDPDMRHAMVLLYSDIHRKYLRIQNTIVSGDMTTFAMGDGETLREALLDLANYALMGVQLCDQHFPENGQEWPGGRQGIEMAQHTALACLLPNTVKEVTPNKPTGDHIDQIAITVVDPLHARACLSNIFGEVLEWHRDEVVAKGVVDGDVALNRADLAYNYQIAGVEFEVLKYATGENWLEEAGLNHGVSHMGVHVSDMPRWKQRMADLGYLIAQEVVTESHTNPAIKDNRRYHYVIYHTVDDIGFYLKLIERLPYPDPAEEFTSDA